MNSKLQTGLNLAFGFGILAILFVLILDRFIDEENIQDLPPVNTVDKAQLNSELALLRAEFIESIRSNNGIGGDNSNFLMSEIADLKVQLAQLENSNSDDAHQQDSNSQPVTDEDIAELNRQREETILTEFQDQPVDEIWSSETASRVDQVLLDPRLSDIGFSTPECKSTTCKIDIQFSDDPDVNDEAEFLLLTQVSEYLPKAKAVRNSDGSLSYYFSAGNNASSQANGQRPFR